MRESVIEHYLRDEVKKRKGRCVKLTAEIGVPDRLAIIPYLPAIFFETKADGKSTATDAQDAWQDWLTSGMHICFRTHSKHEVDVAMEMIDTLLANRVQIMAQALKESENNVDLNKQRDVLRDFGIAEVQGNSSKAQMLSLATSAKKHP